MTKAIFVVRVNNYFPDLCALTLPTIKAYATKIGADYIEIKNRQFPTFPPTYEKMQVYELGKNYDQCLLIDADFLIHHGAPDFTLGISPNYVGFLFSYPANSFFDQDEYFRADGRNIGIASNFVLTDRATHRLWEPLNESWLIAKKKTKREFIIDEYCLSRNLAKYRFKFTGLNYSDRIKYYFHHLGVGTDSGSDPVGRAKNLLSLWQNYE